MLESVARTSRAARAAGGVASIGVADAVVSLIAREGFTLLDAPVVVVAAPDSPVPYAPELEDAYLPSAAGLRDRAGGPPCLLSRAPSIPCDEAPDVVDAVRRELFRCVLVHRLFEERIIALYRQGRIPGSVYTGRGQEAVGAGAGLALGPDDVVAPLNRELSCHLARGVPVAHVFRNYLGRATGPTQGRDGNMHFGVPETASSRWSRCWATWCRSPSARRWHSSAGSSRASR